MQRRAYIAHRVGKRRGGEIECPLRPLWRRIMDQVMSGLWVVMGMWGGV